MDIGKALGALYIGKQGTKSNFEYKSAILRGGLASLSLAVAIAYIFIDLSKHIYTGLPFYVALLASASLTLWLNRAQWYTTASIIFLTSCNAIIFLFATGDIYQSGVYMFFLSISISSFVLFGSNRMTYALTFSIIPVILFFLSYWGHWHIMPSMRFTAEYIRFAFGINFTIAVTACLLQIYFLMTVNAASEKQLTMTAYKMERIREQNDMVIQAVNAGVYEWSIPNNTVFVSPQWKSLLGWSDEELPNITMARYFEMVHPDDLTSIQATINNHFQTQKPYTSEVRLKLKTGEYNWFLDSGISKFSLAGEPLFTVGSIINIHPLKLSEEKIRIQNELLAKANKELDSFVYSVSHDLRAPLSSILGLTNVYAMSDMPEDRDSIVKLISNRAHALDAFIKEVLDYSRNSRMELRISEVFVLDTVREVLAGLAHMEGYDEILIRADIAETLAVAADRDRLKVIISNLVSNAVKYRDPSKSSFILISAERQESTWTLTIQDNGIGIHEEHVNRIFDMFYQAHSVSKGSGLGLYIVTETLNKLNGKIAVKSTFEVGSTFVVELPLDYPHLDLPVFKASIPA